MSRNLIWGLPTGVFHRDFAFPLTAAMAIGFLADDDSPLFQGHVPSCIIALFLLAIRLVMGIAGSRHAGFSDYPQCPTEMAEYFRSAILAEARWYAGNNPGPAFAAMLMFPLVSLLFATGTGLGGGEVEEIHETLAWALLAVVGPHVAGILWHTPSATGGTSLSRWSMAGNRAKTKAMNTNGSVGITAAKSTTNGMTTDIPANCPWAIPPFQSPPHRMS